MKVKVDKEEYEKLLKRVEELERYREAEWERFGGLANTLQRHMEDFFERKCMTVVVKRDRQEIIAELRKKIELNLTEGLE